MMTNQLNISQSVSQSILLLVHQLIGQSIILFLAEISFLSVLVILLILIFGVQGNFFSLSSCINIVNFFLPSLLSDTFQRLNTGNERLLEIVVASAQMGGGYFLLFAFSSFFATAVQFSPPKYSACHSKDFGYGGTVCVCSDELECDSFSEGTTPLPEHEYAVYTSSKAGDRFRLRTGKARQASDGGKLHFAEAEVKFTVNQSEVFQTILGIGGAFTGLYRNEVPCVCSVIDPR